MSLELEQRNIALIKQKGSRVLQMTIDEDINVPDIKPDIDKILQSNSVVNITGTDVYDSKVLVKGEFNCKVLYVPLNDSKPVHNMMSLIPIEESINIDDVSKNDSIKTEYVIEEMKITPINTRKINVKSIVQVKLMVDEKKEMYVPMDISGACDIQSKYDDITICKLHTSKKETYKIKDELAIPSSKPNIMEILWYDRSIKNKEFRIMDDKINIKGVIALDTLYLGESGENNLEFVEHEIPYNGVIECNGVNEDMYYDVDIKIVDDKIQIRPDLDGEERVFSVDIMTQLDIKVYSEEKDSILADVYSLSKDIDLEKESVEYETLLCKNQSQCKIKETIEIDSNEPDIMQIYYATGDVNIDNIDTFEDKVEVEGVVFSKIMYVAADDNNPINVYNAVLPFNQVIDTEGIKKDSRMSIRPSVNYINCSMLGEKELEVKCAVSLDTLVFHKNELNVINNITENELDIKRIQNTPSVVGYIVKDNETLWDIAKTYSTKVEDIRAVNNLDVTDVKRGDKLIIVKNIESLEI
ncbi:hypothetical protein SH1V18_10280 [Vallitalea longa]|uniref:LysM domain-containing protein n=1 Tax=Vallitalea longa TaxID=2936439 RepID=A0A9W6DEK6_9FIRM|nr:SPOCS domain-containing protein [Vallitalea longa]GKX28548.1 hypothetical protein SH1V18_10280 [Vallitalea longa]